MRRRSAAPRSRGDGTRAPPARWRPGRSACGRRSVDGRVGGCDGGHGRHPRSRRATRRQARCRRRWTTRPAQPACGREPAPVAARGTSALRGTITACAPSRRSCTWISTPSSPRWSSATSPRCAASRSSSAASAGAAWWRPRPTRPGRSGSTRRCPPPRPGAAAPTPRSSSGRFHAYRDTSRAVMALLREISPLVEPLSLDEAFVDLEAADLPDHSVASVSALGRELKERVHEVTGGLTGSVGIGSSKLIAKIASDLDKPDGLVVVAPGHGAGPAAADAGHRHPRRRPGHGRAAAPGRRPHRRGARAADRGRAGAAARPGPRHRALRPRPGRGRPRGRARARGQVDQRRGHLRHRPRRPAAARGAARPAGRQGHRAAAQGADVRAARSRSRCGCTTSPR